MQHLLVEKEASTEELLRKANFLLRATIVAIGRLAIVRDATQKQPTEFFNVIQILHEQLSFAIKTLTNIILDNEVEDAAANQ
jgi:hypothetical protein